MKKRLISIILALAVMFSLAAVTSVTANAETFGDFEYELLEDDAVMITGYTGYADALEIPSEIDGKKVTSIGDVAFENCDSLTSVTIGNNVTTIGWSAFFNCESLTSVTIPDSLTRIGDEVFDNTALYNNEANWENGVLYIGNYLIDVITEVSGEYIIKDGTKAIAASAFFNCDSLTSVIIPDSVTTIGVTAFADCDSLTSVIIPDSVTTIDRSAFADCDSLTSVTIPDSLTHIGDEVFDNTALYNNEANWENGVLYIGNYLIDVITEVSGEYIIKDGTKAIAASAFFNCDSLTSVTIPDSVESIGYQAFGYYYNEDNDEFQKLPDFHIYCYKDTAGEQYAIDNGFDYTLLSAEYGDVNYDGKVNMLDVLLIRKYIAKQPIDLDENLADVTCDSKVNMLDVLLIRKYIAKQPVTLGPKG